MEDLNIGSYELEYLPGKNNVTADCLSRAAYPWQLPEDTDSRVCWETEEPVGSFETISIAGGADSIYRALSFILYGDSSRAGDIRENVVDRILSKPTRYGFLDTTKGRKLVELLRDSESFPPIDVLQAVSDVLGSKLVVYFTRGPTFSYQPAQEASTEVLHLKCSGGVHFDALVRSQHQKEQVLPRIGVLQAEGMEVDLRVGLRASVAELWEAQARDDGLCELKRKVRAAARGQETKLSAGLRCFKAKFNRLSINTDNLLVFEAFPNKFVPVVPESTLSYLAEELHVTLSHAGRDKTVNVMYSRFHHPRFPTVIAEVVKECMPCQLHKGRISNKYPVYRRNVKEPYEVLAVDLMELPLSKKNFKCVLVCLDLCTKFAHVVPLKSKKSRPVAGALESRVLASVPQTPKVVLSDNGPEFRGKPFESLLKRYGVKHEYSVPYAAATNGGVERFNQTLRSRLATVCHGDTRNWDKHLYQVVAQYNRTPHTETGRAPCEFFVKEADINVPSTPYWKPPHKFQPLAVGDLVMRKTPYQPAGQRDKLAPKFQGPLRIVEANSNGVTYRAQWLAGRRKTIQLHISQMKKFSGNCAETDGAPLSSPKAVPGGTRTRRTETNNQSAFGLHWENLDYIPLNREHNVPLAAGGPQEVLPNPPLAEDDVVNPVSPAAVVDSPLGDSPSEPSLPSHHNSEIGSWNVELEEDINEPEDFNLPEGDSRDMISPDVEDVVSDHCEVFASVSTPRRSIPPPFGDPTTPIHRQLTPTGEQPISRRTRRQNRHIHAPDGVAREPSPRYREDSSDLSDVFYSESEQSSTVLRAGSGTDGLSGGFVGRSQLSPGFIDDSSILPTSIAIPNFNITIDSVDNFQSVLHVRVGEYRYAALLPYDIAEDD